MRNESTLHARIARLTDDFALAVFTAVRDSWLTQMRGSSRASSPAAQNAAALSPAKAPRKGRRPRPTPVEGGDYSQRIIEALTDMGTPMASSTIAETLGVETEALRLALRSLRASGQVEMHGERRNAVYSLREDARHGGE